MVSPSFHIIIVDDHELFGLGLKELIADFLPQDSISVLRNGQDFIDFLEAGEQVDLLLVNLQIPRVDGKGVIRYLKEKRLPIRSIVISIYDDPRVMEECKCLGADGFIIKDSPLSVLKEGIATVINGLKFFPPLPEKETQLLSELAKQHGLTKREVEIIRMIKNNNSSHHIADILSISYLTVKTHRKNINHKLHINNVVELIDFANRYRI